LDLLQELWDTTEITNPDEMLAKAELARRICEIIAERKLTQAKAACPLRFGSCHPAALPRELLAAGRGLR
jgi:predicted XRE-type DNA-binding protein